MVIENRTTEIGDVLYIKTDVPLIGLIALSSFIDIIVGETGTRLFNKTFRYSVDGVTYSVWTDLTNDNIAGVEVQANDTFYAEYRYERIGTDTSGELEFTSVTLNGEYVEPTTGPAYLASIFNNYFNLNNICSIAWSVNVLEKLYKKGIIPDYIERNLTGDNTTDRDYIDFWRAITHYFALYVCLARQFQFYYQNRDLLLEFIKQRGLFVCNDIQMIDLLYLMEYYYDEVRQRGTRQVFIPKVTDTSVEGSKQVDGEYLRLICYDIRDEFIRNLNRNKHIGWNIGNSSPMYKGLMDRLNTNKYYIDYITDIRDLEEDLSLTAASIPYISIHADSNSESNSTSTNEVDAININNTSASTYVGIGGGDRRIVVNPNLNYQISFFAKTDVQLSNIKFGVNCYDVNDNLVNPLNASTLVASNLFLNNIKLNKANKYYFVRGIIFNQNNFKAYDATKEYEYGTVVLYLGDYYRAKRFVPVNGTEINDGVINSTPGVTLLTSPYFWNFWQILTTSEIINLNTTNIGQGNNLTFDPTKGIVKIDPFIHLAQKISANLLIHSIRVQPLSVNYSRGFVGMTNFLEIFNTSNNLNLSEDKINKETKHYLLPYNTVLKNNFIPTEVNK